MNINDNDVDKLIQDVGSIAQKLDVLPDMQTKLHDIDVKTAVVCNQVETNKEEINTLRKQGNIKDSLLVVFTMAIGTISSILGTRQ